MLDPDAVPGGGTAANDVARLHAEAYARARGVDLLDCYGFASTDPPRVGVQFTITVGKGDISLDQRLPGVLDSWTWSGPVFDWWRRIFNRADGREGRMLARRDDLAKGRRVIPLRQNGAPFTSAPLDSPVVDQRPPWARRADPDFTDSED